MDFPTRDRLADLAAQGLVIRRVPLGFLFADPANSRLHPSENLDAIEASLRRFGQVDPLVVQKKSGRVIGGNGRLAVMRRLSWTECDVVELDLDDLQATALSIALNRTSDTSSFDEDALAQLLQQLRSAGAAEGIGFSTSEIDTLIAELEAQARGAVEDPGPEEPPEKPVSRVGDMWTLGDHRLLCGDSTKADDVTRVMGEDRAALLSTDPPYCVNYTGNDRPIHDGKPSGKDWSHVYREVDIEDLGEFLHGVFTACLPAVHEDAGIYIWHAHVQQPVIASVFERHNLLLHQVIVWVKPTATFGHGFYRFDAAYTNDNLNRLTDAQEGTWNGSSITSEKREQAWTLDHLGNWPGSTLDLDGDGTYVDPDELDEVRTHNAVNELTARDIDHDSTNDYTLAYDAVGNLTDDGEAYKYVWDPFGRLREVKNRSTNALVAEFTYNGLGFRIGVHEDTDTDGDVDGSDLWYYTAFDERWRALATFRSSDSSPKEEFVPHNAGLDGRGGSSYIDLVITRDKDANTAWTAASDGTLEERGFYAQNWRADVVALVGSDHLQWEQDRYSAYGVPFGLPGGDCDSDGDCDSVDVTQVQTWIDAAAYDVRGDIDLDGDVDAGDKATIEGGYVGLALGREKISSRGNIRALSGCQSVSLSIPHLMAMRLRVLSTSVGDWVSRDPSRYADSANLYGYARSSPVSRWDPSGALSLLPSGGGGAGDGTTSGSSSVDFTVMEGHAKYYLYPPRFEFPPILNSMCCAKPLKDYDNSATWGKVMCCNGRHVICISTAIPGSPAQNQDVSKKVKAAIDNCAALHEQAHINAGDLGPCAPGEIKPAPWAWAEEYPVAGPLDTSTLQSSYLAATAELQKDILDAACLNDIDCEKMFPNDVEAKSQCVDLVNAEKTDNDGILSEYQKWANDLSATLDRLNETVPQYPY